jgi:hypothetical protein
MRTFEDDDTGYLTWVESHQHGFVVNSYRRPDPRYLILHRATCGTITGRPARRERWTTGDFIKPAPRPAPPSTSGRARPPAASSPRAVSVTLTDHPERSSPPEPESPLPASLPTASPLALRTGRGG